MKPKLILKFLLFLFLFYGIERLCHHATDGFALVNIYSPAGTPSITTPMLDPALASLFEEPYSYLNSGSQSYVFISADGQTVLKFFKFQHMRIPPWINVLPLPKSLAEKREAKRKKKQTVLTKTLGSYALAFDKMSKESGLLFVHLSPTKNLKTHLTIYDKIGKRHTINLDEVEFILQRKANLVFDTLDSWMEKGEKKLAEKGIRDLLRLAQSRCKKGIFDKDPDFATNFGFVNGTPIQIDVGRLSLNDSEKNPEVYRPEMIRITRAFQEWIEKNHPDLLDSFDREIDNLNSCP